MQETQGDPSFDHRVPGEEMAIRSSTLAGKITDRGLWGTVHGVTGSRTGLDELSAHTLRQQ